MAGHHSIAPNGADSLRDIVSKANPLIGKSVAETCSNVADAISFMSSVRSSCEPSAVTDSGEYGEFLLSLALEAALRFEAGDNSEFFEESAAKAALGVIERAAKRAAAPGDESKVEPE